MFVLRLMKSDTYVPLTSRKRYLVGRAEDSDDAAYYAFGVKSQAKTWMTVKAARKTVYHLFDCGFQTEIVEL